MTPRESKFQHRGLFAAEFGVPDGGRYANDWASRIDDVLAELSSLRGRVEQAEKALAEIYWLGGDPNRVEEIIIGVLSVEQRLARAPARAVVSAAPEERE